MNELALDQIRRRNTCPGSEGARSPVQFDWGALGNVRLRLTVEVGRARITVRDIMNLEEGAVIPTGTRPGEHLGISLNDNVFCRAKMSVEDGRLLARLTKIVGGRL